MNDLDQMTFAQFERRFAGVEHLVPDPAAQLVTDRSRVRRRPAGVRPAVVLAAGLLLVAVAVIGVVGSKLLTPPVTPSPSPAASVPVAPSVAPTPGIPTAWTSSDLPSPGCAATVIDVVTFKSGLAAIGTCGRTTEPTVVWISDDGSTWRFTASIPHADVYGVLGEGSQLLLVGQDVTNGADAASWSSTDGATWTRSTSDLGVGVINAVVRGPSGYLAVGSTGPNIPAWPGLANDEVWTSADGATWTLVAGAGARFGGDIATTLVATSSGWLTGNAGGIWQSVDGTTWLQVNDTNIQQLVAGGPGFVARGVDQQGNATLATSIDGSAWAPVGAPGLDLPAVAADAGHIAVVGWPDQTETGSPTVWFSVDGASWTALPALPAGLQNVSLSLVAGNLRVTATTGTGSVQLSEVTLP
jgi:hypothetical protein